MTILDHVLDVTSDLHLDPLHLLLFHRSAFLYPDFLDFRWRVIKVYGHVSELILTSASDSFLNAHFCLALPNPAFRKKRLSSLRATWSRYVVRIENSSL
jgi:hypothetical protein